MEISISIGTILLSVLAGLGSIAIAHILKPIMLILRDKCLWWYIKRSLCNEDTKSAIRERDQIHESLKTEYGKDVSRSDKDGSIQCYIGQKPVTATTYENYKEERERRIEKLSNLRLKISTQKEKLNTLIRNFQLELENPIIEYEENYIQNAIDPITDRRYLHVSEAAPANITSTTRCELTTARGNDGKFDSAPPKG